MNRNISVLVISAFVALACAEGPVRRRAVLEPAEALPEASILISGDALRLELSGVEKPVAPAKLVAWANRDDEWKPLGELVPGVDPIFRAAPGDSWLDVAELAISVETETDPPGPSAKLLFRGSLGSPLALGGAGGPKAESLEHAGVVAIIEDQGATIEHEGLPAAPAGMHYAVWLAEPAEADAHEEEPAGDGHDGHGSKPDAADDHDAPLLLGRLTSAAHDVFQSDRLLAAYAKIFVTLELDAGADAANTDATVLSGAMLQLGGAVAEAEQAHEH